MQELLKTLWLGQGLGGGSTFVRDGFISEFPNSDSFAFLRVSSILFSNATERRKTAYKARGRSGILTKETRLTSSFSTKVISFFRQSPLP